jgi:hypothetical protein
MIDKFRVNNVEVTIVSEDTTIQGRASLNPNALKVLISGSQLRDYARSIVDEEMQTQTTIDFIKGLVLEVLAEQNLI